MRDAYTEDYYRQTRRRYPLKERLAARLRTWLQPRALARCIDALPPGARVLDVGCGKGDFLHKLAAYRPDLVLHGVDFTLAEAQPGFAAIRGDATRLPFADDGFDLVMSQQLIEHLSDGGALVAELARVTAPGGHVYLDCPDVRGTSPWIKPNFYDDPTHVRPYTQTALRRLFALMGLTPLRSGHRRDGRITWLGPLYLPVALVKRDGAFWYGWLGHVFGVWIYILARKPAR